MITEETLNKLYSGVLQNTPLTPQLLSDCGLSSYDIYKLITEGVIISNNSGSYSLVSPGKLFDFGKENCSIMDANTLFSVVISLFLANNVKSAFSTLRRYLNIIGKSQYEFLLIDLIKISVLEKDKTFTKPMISLLSISNECFEPDISNYILEFYMSLSQNKFEEARLYLDILSKLS